MEVVVVTRDFNYWGERSLRDTIRLYFRGKIEILKADDSRIIKAGISKEGITFKMPAPLVVRLLEFAGYKIKKERIEYSDQAVFDRDKNICQYWHKDKNGKRFKYRCTNGERTIDHVIPKAQNGKTSFTNCVCSCKHCNSVIKRNRTPKEAGLELIRAPKEPRLRKGDRAVIIFSFNPNNKAHVAYLKDIMCVDFSHVVQ